MTGTAVANRHTLAGADYVPRRHVPKDSPTSAGKIHWFYEPRLRPGVVRAQTLCTPGPHSNGMFVSNSDLREQLKGGEPCERCNARWPLPTGSGS